MWEWQGLDLQIYQPFPPPSPIPTVLQHPDLPSYQANTQATEFPTFVATVQMNQGKAATAGTGSGLDSVHSNYGNLENNF